MQVLDKTKSARLFAAAPVLSKTLKNENRFDKIKKNRRIFQ